MEKIASLKRLFLEWEVFIIELIVLKFPMCEMF